MPDAQTISLDLSESVELVCAMRSVPRILKGEMMTSVTLFVCCLIRLELRVYRTSGFAAAQPEMEQKNEGCQHM